MSRRAGAPHALVVALLFLLLCASWAGAQPTATGDGIGRVVDQLERALRGGDSNEYFRMLAPEANRDRAAEALAPFLTGGLVNAVVRERDRASIGGGKARVVLDVFVDFGASAQLATWRLDVRRADSASAGDTWLVAGQQVLSAVNGLYRLSFNPAKAYGAHGVSITAEDLDLQMTDGSVFVIEAGGRPTALVIVGKGDMRFRPSPATERGQMKIFAGSEEMQTPIDGAFVRLNPDDIAEHVKGLDHPQADLRDVKRAEEMFREYAARSYTLDLGDLSTDAWSLLPHGGDMLAEIATRRFGSLTFARSHDEPEDVSLFDRKARRYIASYGSRDRLAARGPFYDEGASAEFDIDHYDIDARIIPDHGLIDAQAQLSLVVRADSLTSLSLRLAEGMTVHSVTGDGFGRLLALRVRGHDSIVVSLPAVLVRGTRLTLLVDYSGTLPVPRTQSEAVDVGGQQDPQGGQIEEPRVVPIEDSYVYSNHSRWYPQGSVNDYATASLRLIVPARFGAVASGDRVVEPAGDPGAADLQRAGLRRYVFHANKPVRYLACVFTPLVLARSTHVRLDEPGRPGLPNAGAATPSSATLDLAVYTNPREKNRGKELADLASDIVRFYARLMGDCPYPTLNLALVERDMPGGHSPAYMSIINFPVPGSGISWRSDPATVDEFREYFVAHEIAHQWWGQAVGWKNYHEQWLSEGFAQYFAALYAEHAHGEDLFQDVLRRWQRWAVDKSDQGPVYLGYRVGHLKNDQRVFRAVVYNKSATVLHMLRRMVGDEPFFAGLRRFYRDFRFRMAGTDDLQRAIEAEAHVPLQRFFDRWIYGDTLPRVRVSARTDNAGARAELVVAAEQVGEVFDMPLAVSIAYADRPATAVTVRLDAAEQEFRIPLAGSLRRFDLNRVDVVPFSDFSVNTAPSTQARARPRDFRQP